MTILYSCYRKSLGGETASRQIRCIPDWSEYAIANDHLWTPTSISGDCCYVGDNDCTVINKIFYAYCLKKVLILRILSN